MQASLSLPYLGMGLTAVGAALAAFEAVIDGTAAADGCETGWGIELAVISTL